MARPISILAIGDSITSGSFSNPPNTGPGTTFDPARAYIGQLNDLLQAVPGGKYGPITNTAIGASGMSAWLPDSPVRIFSATPTPPPLPGAPVLPPTPGNQPLWDYGVAPFLPVDLVLMMGEVNQPADQANQQPTRPYLVLMTYVHMARALLLRGAGAVMVSVHGQPDLTAQGQGAIPGASWIEYMRIIGSMLQGQRTRVVGEITRGVDCRDILTPSLHYGDGIFGNADDVHPNEAAGAVIAQALLDRIEVVPRYVLQPDQDGS